MTLTAMRCVKRKALIQNHVVRLIRVCVLAIGFAVMTMKIRACFLRKYMHTFFKHCEYYAMHDRICTYNHS